MPLRIDLTRYLEEFEAFTKMAGHFVEPESAYAVAEALNGLRTPVSSGTAVIPWETRKGHPIQFKTSQSYDGLKKGHNVPLRLTFAFACKFTRPAHAKRTKVESR